MVSSAAPSEAAMGEHVHAEASLGQPDAVSALPYWTMHSKRGRLSVHPEEGCECRAGVLCARP